MESFASAALSQRSWIVVSSYAAVAPAMGYLVYRDGG
jgi:hypothetical protein